MHKLDLTVPQTHSEQPQTSIEPMQTAVDDLPSKSDNRASVSPNTDTHMSDKHPMKKRNAVLGFCVAAILAGTATGYGSYRLYAGSDSMSSRSGAPVMSQVAGDSIKNGDIFGSSDTVAFKDSPSGYLEAGGINGEGSHKLLRPGGVSQTVYLTSSVTDLDKLLGMEVKVWGETFKAQKAGWLMDVGRVEVIDVDATAPTEE